MRSKKLYGLCLLLVLLAIFSMLCGIGWFTQSSTQPPVRESAETTFKRGNETTVSSGDGTLYPAATPPEEETLAPPRVDSKLGEALAPTAELIETPQSEELVETAPEEVVVDLICQFPEEVHAAYWKPLMHRLYLVGTDSDQQTRGHVGRPQPEDDGSWIVPRVLTFRPKSEHIAIAVLAAFAPYDEFGRVIPGHIAFFAGHRVDPNMLSGKIALKSNASTVNFLVRLTGTDRRTGRIEFRLASHASMFPWDGASTRVPDVWPESVDARFRLLDEAWAAPHHYLRLFRCSTEADFSGVVSFWGVPKGLMVSDWVVARGAQRMREGQQHYQIDGDDFRGVNHYANDTRERFYFPLHESTFSCFPDKELPLPEVVFESDGPLSDEALSSGCVICSALAGTTFARATYHRATQQWKWVSRIGRSVVRGYYDGGGRTNPLTFSASLPGYRSNTVKVRLGVGQITFYLEPLDEPWTLSGRVTSSVGHLPAKIEYRRGKHLPVQFASGWTDRDGSLRFEQREGPREGEKLSDCYVRIDVDIDRLRELLLSLLPDSEPWLQLHVALNPNGDGDGKIDPMARTMSCESSAHVLVGADATQAVRLEEFLVEHQLLEEYMERASR